MRRSGFDSAGHVALGGLLTSKRQTRGAGMHHRRARNGLATTQRRRRRATERGRKRTTLTPAVTAPGAAATPSIASNSDALRLIEHNDSSYPLLSALFETHQVEPREPAMRACQLQHMATRAK